VLGFLRKSEEAKGRIGIALGRKGVAFALVSGPRNAPTLERCELLPLDAAAGPAAVAAALRGAGLPGWPVHAVLAGSDYQLVMVEAPDVPPAELRAAMRWRLKEAVEFPVDEAVVDVFEMPAHSRGAQGRMMYAVAARRDAVDRQVQALGGSGLAVLDVPELCLRNLAAHLPAAAAGVALLHLDDASATVVLVHGRTFYFARQMELGVLAPADPAHDAAVEDVSGIVLELQRSLDYYERHFDQPPITRVVVSPAGRRAEQLATRLAAETGFDVETLDLNRMLRCAQPVAAATQADCLMAVAAALREERRTL
jgi:MSHA biogenesis protein MshI